MQILKIFRVIPNSIKHAIEKRKKLTDINYKLKERERVGKYYVKTADVSKEKMKERRNNGIADHAMSTREEETEANRRSCSQQ